MDDYSDNYFSIVSVSNTPPSIAILSPNGGEKLEAGKTYTITWEQVGIKKIDIQLISKSLNNSYSINSNLTVDSNSTIGSYQYTVPTNIIPANDFKLHIAVYNTDGTLYMDDYSDNCFSVVLVKEECQSNCKKNSDSQTIKPEITQPSSIDIPYKNGTLLKSKNGKQVYFVDEEKLRPINSLQTFKNHGFKVKDVKNIASNEMEKYEIDDQALLPYPDGTLLKVNGKIYFVQDEKLRYISSFKIFRAHNFKIKNVINVANNIIDEYEMGENLLPYASGTLLKVANRLYFVQGDELKYISSLKAFKNLKRKNIIVVAPKAIEEYEEGEPLK